MRVTTVSLLITMCAVAPVASALASARIGNEIKGEYYILIITLGALLGMLGACMLFSAGAIIYAFVQRKSELSQACIALVFHAVGLLWFFFLAYSRKSTTVNCIAAC